MILERFKKRKHYKRKIRVMYQKRWDLEFLKEKLKAMREGFRVEYDRIKEIIDAASVRLEEEKKKDKSDQKIVDSLTNLKKKQEPDIAQLKKQIEGIDGQIEGPEGVNEKIESYRTVAALLKKHIKDL
tara:strand:+ start:838 stop:1221 length:384 start_codon:yes stop_codon:yes gene_type:complete